jgi:hypothetical protein
LSIFLYFTINIKYHLLTRDTYIVLVAWINVINIVCMMQASH